MLVENVIEVCTIHPGLSGQSKVLQSRNHTTMGEPMNGNRRCAPAIGIALAALSLSLSASALAAVDAAAAQALARQNNCFKCHAVDKNKEATSWKEIASKLKNDKNAQATLMKHLTTGPKVKFLDGHEEEHPIIKTKDQDQIKNLIDWILSL
jgi:cytochrome c